MKKLFCMILALCMIMSGMIFCVSATESDTQSEDSIASVTVGESTRYYTTFEEAITAVNAVEENENWVVVSILKNFSDTTNATANSAVNGARKITRKNVEIQGNGYTVSHTNSKSKYEPYLEFAGENFKLSNLTIHSNSAGFSVTGYGEYTIDHVTITVKGTTDASVIDTARLIGNAGGALKITLKDCNFSNNWKRAFNVVAGANTVDVTMNGGSYSSTSNKYRPNDITSCSADSVFTFSNAYVYGITTAALRVCAGAKGKVTVESGLFYNAGTGEVFVNLGAVDVTVNGGTYVSSNSSAKGSTTQYRIANVTIDTSKSGTLTVNGGRFLYLGTLGKDVYGAYSTDGSTFTKYPDNSNSLVIGQETAPSTLIGASVRLKAEPGIRFESEVGKARLEALKQFAAELALKDAAAAEVTYGTLVIPKSLLGDKALTHAAFDGVEDEALKFADIVAKDGIHYDADGNATIYAAITGIPYAQNEAVLVARAYAKVTAGGFTFYVYSETTTERSMQYVATAAKADAETYNRLNAEQKAMLESYINGGAE